MVTGTHPVWHRAGNFFLQAKEPDLRGEVNRDEVGSLKQQYPLPIQRGERAGVPAKPPALEVWPSLPAHLQSLKMSRVVRRLQPVSPYAW